MGVRLAAFLTAAGVAFAAAPVQVNAAPTQFYVDRTVAGCSDSGTGSATTPFCGIPKGVSMVQPGSTLFIGNGTYASTITPAVSGTASAPITITAWPGRAPRIGQGVSNAVYISGRSYLTVSNLTLADTTHDAAYLSSSNHVTLTGNTILSAGAPMSGQVAFGVYLSGTTDSLVTRNVLRDNTKAGIYLAGSTTRSVISYNDISKTAAGYSRIAPGMWATASGNTFLGNVSHDNEDSGLNFTSGGNNNLVALNVFYNNGDHGVDNLNVTGGRIVGNTVFRNCTSGINVEGTSGSYTVKNNIAVDNAVYPAYAGISCSRRAGNIGIWDSAPPTTVVDHNLVWLSKSGVMYTFRSTYSSLSAMKSATGQEVHGVQADPRFASPGAWDLRLAAGSPAIDRADSSTSGEQAADVLGAPRVDDPATSNANAEGSRPYDDLGAYEYQAVPVQPVPPVAVLSVSPSSGAAPLAVSVSASGSSDPQGRALTYTFDFGDGSALLGPQAGASVGHTYAAAGSYTARVTVTNNAGLSDTATAAVSVSTPPPPPQEQPSYTAQVATNYSMSTNKTSGYVSVWRTAGVAADSLVVVTLQLFGSTAPGPVAATDARGNTYQVGGDVTDGAGSRLVVLYARSSTALAVGDRITATFPTAATGFRMTADEFRGVTRLDREAQASGSTASFSSGPTTTTTAASEVVFAAVATKGASGNPSWASGWSAISPYAVGSTYLGRAYRLPTVTGTFSASGTTTGSWLSLVATFAP